MVAETDTAERIRLLDSDIARAPTEAIRNQFVRQQDYLMRRLAREKGEPS